MKQVRYSPVVTVIGAGLQRSQPIWVDDVAEYFAQAIDAPEAANRTFELGGPDIVDWNGSTGRSPRCSASAAASCTFRSPSRAPARS